ncbi:hypothetical protein JRB56_002781, partial [Providencia stuartii]
LGYWVSKLHKYCTSRYSLAIVFFLIWMLILPSMTFASILVFKYRVLDVNHAYSLMLVVLFVRIFLSIIVILFLSCMTWIQPSIWRVIALSVVLMQFVLWLDSYIPWLTNLRH